jgi:hypothetical protein
MFSFSKLDSDFDDVSSSTDDGHILFSIPRQSGLFRNMQRNFQGYLNV